MCMLSPDCIWFYLKTYPYFKIGKVQLMVSCTGRVYLLTNI